MSVGKEYIKHFEFACMYILSSESVLIVIFQCFSIMGMQMPPVPKSAQDFSVLTTYSRCEKKEVFVRLISTVGHRLMRLAKGSK